MEPYTNKCCTSEIVNACEVEAQYEQRKRKINEILNSDDVEVDENRFSLTDVVKQTIDNAYNEYIRICHSNDGINGNSTEESTVEPSCLSDLEKSVIEAANKINPTLGDIITKIPKIEEIEMNYMNSKHETVDEYYSSLNNKKRTRVLKNHKSQMDESKIREESQSVLVVDENEMIFTVEMYILNKNRYYKKNRFRPFVPYPLCICNFLSSMNLSSIKDVIDGYCPPKVIDGSLDTSGFLFINNTFYNDTRRVLNVHYSKPILDWIKEQQAKNNKIPIEINFQTNSMENTTFKSLKLSLGERYLYYHNKKCEHIIIFTDIRSYNKVSDKKYIESYPDITFLSYNPSNKSGENICRMCNICEYLPAKHVTVGDKYSGEYVCYFCDNCFQSLHYDQNGDLLYDDFEYYCL